MRNYYFFFAFDLDLNFNVIKNVYIFKKISFKNKCVLLIIKSFFMCPDQESATFLYFREPYDSSIYFMLQKVVNFRIEQIFNKKF